MTTDQHPETFEGILNHVRFQNDNGFLIGLFQDGESLSQVCALGNVLRPEIGMSYKLRGKWINDPKWGKQFKFENYQVVVPQSTDGIFRYIVRIAKWVGPAVGTDLIAKYGDQTLNVLKTDPERVAREIKGITPTRAATIQKLIKDNEEYESAFIELETMLGGQGLSKTLPMKLITKWGSDAPAKLRENPYRLIDIHGIGFPTADRVAISRFEVNEKSVHRQCAGINHIILENTFEGHTWIKKTELVLRVEGLLGTSPEEGLSQMLGKGKELVEEDGYVTSLSIASDEALISKRIAQLGGYR